MAESYLVLWPVPAFSVSPPGGSDVAGGDFGKKRFSHLEVTLVYLSVSLNLE